MYAIIKISNKQFLVKKNNIIYSDKLNNKLNSIVEFNKVLLVYNNYTNISIGFPYVKNYVVTAIVLKHLRSKKNNIIKFKRRKHYLKQYNFRILTTKLKILEILNL